MTPVAYETADGMLIRRSTWRPPWDSLWVINRVGHKMAYWTGRSWSNRGIARYPTAEAALAAWELIPK